MMKQYISDNWDGWPLHGALAFLFFLCFSYKPVETLLVLNTVFWPDREATQHEGYRNIWTPHRIIEWAVPIIVGFIAYWYFK